MQAQLDLFADVLSLYGQADGPISNEQAYAALIAKRRVSKQALEAKSAIGKSGQAHSVEKRRYRWYQQTLRSLGLLERAEEAGRGHWKITAAGRKKLTPAQPGRVLISFSTELGIALWGESQSVFPLIDEPITLYLTSPPYPLRKPRAYGGPTEAQYVDWLCIQMEPLVRHLVPGGSVCLNLSNDIFEQGLPSRSLYRERLVLALHDRLGLHKMDEIIWHAPNKPPAPYQWASRTRQQLNTAWEPVYWFTNDPRLCKSDNRRVLQPHTKAHEKLMAGGGERRTASYGDGAYRIKNGSFGQSTAGKIPRNVLTMAHNSAHKQFMRKAAEEMGVPHHGAMMPIDLARFLVEFLTEKGDLVADNFFGRGTTGAACEELGRRWIGTELMAENVCGASVAFKSRHGYNQKFILENLHDDEEHHPWPCQEHRALEA